MNLIKPSGNRGFSLFQPFSRPPTAEIAWQYDPRLGTGASGSQKYTSTRAQSANSWRMDLMPAPTVVDITFAQNEFLGVQCT